MNFKTYASALIKQSHGTHSQKGTTGVKRKSGELKSRYEILLIDNWVTM